MEHYHSSTALMQIRNDSIICYSKVESNKAKFLSNNFVVKETGELAKTYSGTQTTGVKKRKRKAIDIMLQCTEKRKVYNPILGYYVDHQIGMITLTFSDNSRFISGKEAHKTCLRPFLDWLTKTKKAKFYIWITERQKSTDHEGKLKMSNGQLHYHIITDAFIPYDEVQKKWNYLQNEAGYLEEFYNKYNHRNPNSTDIHEMKDVNDLGAYLLKYITKEPDRLDNESDEEFKTRVNIDGKIWDCSNNLSGKDFFKVEHSLSVQKKLDYLVARDLIKKFEIDYCTMYFFKGIKPYRVLDDDSKRRYLQYKMAIRDPDNFIDGFDLGDCCDLGSRLTDLIKLRVAVPKTTIPIRTKRKQRRFDANKLTEMINSNTFI